MIRYYTFGLSHFHNGTALHDKYVKVTCPTGDPRALLIAWLGNNKFSSEYSALEFTKVRWKYPMTEYMSIEVSAPCPLCDGRIPTDDCRGCYPGALLREDDTEICSDCGREGR